VVEAGRVAGGLHAGLGFEPVEVAADVADQHAGEVVGESVADNYALDGYVFAVGGHAVGGHLPAAVAKAVGQVVEGPTGGGVFEGPGDDGEIDAGGKHLEGPERRYFSGKLDGNLLTGLVDGAVAGFPETDEVVVLGDDLAGGAGEVDGQGGHGAAEVVDVEDEFGRQVAGFAPYDPADTGVDEAVFMA